MTKNVYLTCILCLTSIIHQLTAQTWTSKNENLNYVARHECSFVQSGNKFIMFGGREQAKRLDIYDYTNNSWTRGASAPKEFNHFQATEFDGLVWVIGAFQTNNFPNEAPANAIYIYNPALNTWIEGPNIPASRRRGGAGLVVHNKKFYLVAGNSGGHNGGFVPWLDVYDPINNTWTQLPNAPRARDHFSAVILNNKIYAASGRLSGGNGGTFAPLIAQVDVYNLNTNSWTTLSNSKNVPTPRAGASVVAFNGELYVIGGEGINAGPAFNKVEAFNPSTNSWSTKANLNHGRHGTQAIVSGQGIHIAGGSPSRGGGRMRNMEVYKTDAPVGAAIQASTLSAVNEVTFNANQTKNIALTSSGGNAGNFITNVSIFGSGASSFTIQRNVFKHLIKSNSSQNIRISANASVAQKTATLLIRYDNNKTVSVTLKGPGATTNPTPTPTGIPFGEVIAIKPVKASWINNTFSFLSARFNQNGMIRPNRSSIGEWEKFIVENGGNGNVRIKVKNFGAGYKYLVVSGNSISATGNSATAAAAQFKWETVSASRFGLKSVVTGKYVQIPQNQNQNTAILNVRGTQRGDWELFEYTISGSARTSPSRTKIKINSNPISDGIIDLSNANGFSYTIFNISGQVLQSGNVNSNSIDVSSLSPGVYIVRFLNEGIMETKKVILN